MRSSLFPTRNIQVRPAFWGVDRDFKDFVESFDRLWEGNERTTNTYSLKETEQAFLYETDMPGVKKNQLEIDLEGDLLHIKAERISLIDEERKSTFNRSLRLPKEVDAESIEARLEDGVLYLALPKSEKAKSRKVTVNEGAGDHWKKLLNTNEEE